MTDFVTVPVEPTEQQWGGLARRLIVWMDMFHDNLTPANLFDYMRVNGTAIPQWLRDEPEMQALNSVPSAGTRAMLIYKAMVYDYQVQHE